MCGQLLLPVGGDRKGQATRDPGWPACHLLAAHNWPSENPRGLFHGSLNGSHVRHLTDGSRRQY